MDIKQQLRAVITAGEAIIRGQSFSGLAAAALLEIERLEAEIQSRDRAAAPAPLGRKPK